MKFLLIAALIIAIALFGIWQFMVITDSVLVILAAFGLDFPSGAYYMGGAIIILLLLMYAIKKVRG